MKGSKLVVKKSIILGNFFEEGETEGEWEIEDPDKQSFVRSGKRREWANGSRGEIFLKKLFLCDI